MEERPISDVTRKYIAGGTPFLKNLEAVYMKRLVPFAEIMGVAPESLLRIVDEETAIRVNDAMTLEFEPGHGRKLSPLVFQDMMQTMNLHLRIGHPLCEFPRNKPSWIGLLEC